MLQVGVRRCALQGQRRIGQQLMIVNAPPPQRSAGASRLRSAVAQWSDSAWSPTQPASRIFMNSITSTSAVFARISSLPYVRESATQTTTECRLPTSTQITLSLNGFTLTEDDDDGYVRLKCQPKVYDLLRID
jgi:hypothetical protein